jgi:hypothetical protein
LNTLWHRLFAKLLELLLAPVHVTVLSELPVTSDPPQVDVLLLRREGDRWTDEQRALLPDGVRDRNAAHHLLECKITESVTEESLQQALTYEYLYRQSQQLAVADLQTYIVSAQTTQKEKLVAWGYTVSEFPGVYVSTYPLLHKVVLLLLNELRDTPHNEYFRLFASRQRVRERAFNQVQPNWSSAAWTVILALQRAYALEGATMKPEVTLESLLAVGEEMRRKIIASAPPEDRLAGLAPEDLQALLQQIDRYLSQTTSQTTIPSDSVLQEKRSALLRVLRHNFGEIPPAIITRIEATVDAEQLNQWFDQALDAPGLDAINFAMSQSAPNPPGSPVTCRR